jgi:hypothetical protein
MLSASELGQQMANKTDRLDSSDAPEKNGKTVINLENYFNKTFILLEAFL